MEMIVYGFQPNIAGYSMKDISLYFFVFAILIIITGRAVEKNCILSRYMLLLRYGTIIRLWRRVWIKQMLLSIGVVIVLFCVIDFINIATSRDIFSYGKVLPFLLWMTGICAISSLQMLLGLWKRGTAISVLLLIGVEVFSVYMFPILGDRICYLPGSYLMLKRTLYLDGTMPVGLIMALEIGFSVFVCLSGAYIYKRSGQS